MLILAFKIGADQYGLPSAAIEEAIALVNLRRLEDPPRGIVGDFNYHGTMVPAIDLCELILGRPSHRRWSTRILVTRLVERETAGKFVGIITENATELIDSDSGSNSSAAVRLLQLEDYFDDDIRKFLTTHGTEPPADWEPANEDPIREPLDSNVALTIMKREPAPPPAVPPPATTRRRRAPRLSYLDKK